MQQYRASSRLVPIVCGLLCVHLSATGCNSSNNDTTTGSPNGGQSSTSTGNASTAGTPSFINPANCEPAPLRTGLTDKPSTDSYDCAILQMTEKYGEPDAMIFKAIIYVESRFQFDAVACPNLPCGTPSGWSSAESGCFGLMQIVLACNPKSGDLGLLADGHPNLTKDPSSADWAKSIFNPTINIERGIAGIADNRRQVRAAFPGCTEEQYTLMAIGNYNSYGSTKSCTSFNTEYDNLVLERYQVYTQAAGWRERDYSSSK